MPEYEFSLTHITGQKVYVFGVFPARMRENMDQKNSEYGHISRRIYSR